MKDTLERISPNALVIVVAVVITLMQVASAYWVRETTTSQRQLDIRSAIDAHMKDPQPHNSDLGRTLDANQRAVMQRVLVLETVVKDMGARTDRIQDRIDREHK